MKVAIVDRGGISRFLRAEGEAGWLDPVVHDVHLLTDISRIEGGVPSSQFTSVFGFRIDDELATESILRSIAKTSGLDAIVVFPENLQLCVARVRATEEISGPREEWVKRFRDKQVMKSFARQAGLRCADSIPVDSRSDILPFLARHSKVVIKPRDGSGSSGVHVLSGPDDLIKLPDKLGNHQAEGFIEGAMVHVDAVVQGGRVKVSVVSRYLDSTLSYTRGRPMGSVVSEDPQLRSSTTSMLNSVIQSFEVVDSVLHLEAFVDRDGLVFNEIACRAGGGPIVETIAAHTGYNIMGAMIDLAMQVPLNPNGKSDQTKCHGWVLFYAPEGIFHSIDDSSVPEEWIVQKRINVKENQRLAASKGSGDSVCGFVVRGANESEVECRIRHMQKTVDVQVRQQ